MQCAAIEFSFFHLVWNSFELHTEGLKLEYNLSQACVQYCFLLNKLVTILMPWLLVCVIYINRDRRFTFMCPMV